MKKAAVSVRRKPPFSTSLEPELLKWLEGMIKKGTFRDRSHGIEKCVAAIARLPESDQIALLFRDEPPLVLPVDAKNKLEVIRVKKGFDTLEDTIRHCLNHLTGKFV